VIMIVENEMVFEKNNILLKDKHSVI
jgi:hypothetical protein